MNINSYLDVEQFLQFKQVYCRKQILDQNFKTKLDAGIVYDFGKVQVDCINTGTIAIEFYFNGKKEPITIYEYSTDQEFFAFIKRLFVPVHLMVQKYFNN
jgi:hypothetical protein